MRAIVLFILVCLFASVEAQEESKLMDINYFEVKKAISQKNSGFYYPKLLEKYNSPDSILTLNEYAHVYYGFSFQPDYLNNRPDENTVDDIFKKGNYEEVILQCADILSKNPVSLRANELMAQAMVKEGKPENEWKMYLNRYRMLRKVIIHSGDGTSKDRAFKVIYPSDMDEITRSYFEISGIYSKKTVGSCNCFEVEPSDYFQASSICYDITRYNIVSQQLNLDQ